MADTRPKQGDNDVVILRKILQQLRGDADAGTGGGGQTITGDVTVTSGNITVDGTVAVSGGNITVGGSVAVSSGNVGGFTQVINSAALTVSGGAFSQYDCVGGIQNWDVFRTGQDSGILSSVALVDADNQKAAIDLYVFSSNPSASTFTNNTAVSLNSADYAKIIAKVSITSGDYVNITSAIAVATVSSLGIPIYSAGNLYFALVTTGTPTYTSGSLRVSLGVLQD
jgi:hypothetical protein